MFEWTEEMSKLSPVWQARGERKKARRLKVLWFRKEPKLNEKLKKSILSGNIKKVVKAFRAEEKIEKKEANYVFLVLKKMRVIMYYHLNALAEINRAIMKDKDLGDPEKKVLIDKINDDIKIIKNLDQALFQGEDNFSHGGRTISIRQALDEGSLLNDFYFCGRNEIRRVRKPVRDEKHLLGALQKAAKLKKIQEIVGKLENDLTGEKKNELKEATDAMLILYEIKKKIVKMEAAIKELVTRKGFPEDVGEKLIKEFNEADTWMKQHAKLDTHKERRIMGMVPRAEGHT